MKTPVISSASSPANKGRGTRQSAPADLIPQQATLLTSRRDSEHESVSLYESPEGSYFIERQNEDGGHITPVTPGAAGRILAAETQRQMSKIYSRKLDIPARGVVDGRWFDTTKDTLIWSDCADDVEAAAVYRTAHGVEYLRLINSWRDVVALISRRDRDDVRESLEAWLCSDRSFLRLIDWPHTTHVSRLMVVNSNDDSHDINPWLPRKQPVIEE